MRNIDDIEDAYDIGYNEEIDKYREKLKQGSNRIKARKNFKKNFHKLLNKRNKQYSLYLRNNKDKILEIPEKKKKKKVEKKKVYRAYHIDFNHGFFYKNKQKLKLFWFNFRLFYRSIKYNIIPSWIKFMFFRIGIFFSSLLIDIGNFFRSIKNGIVRIINRRFGRVRRCVLKIMKKIMKVFDKIKEWNNARNEIKKKKEEKDLLMRQKEIKERQNRVVSEEKNEDEKISDKKEKKEQGYSPLK